MSKKLLSHQAGKATQYIFSKKPSVYVPFKGEFPVVEEWRERDFYDQATSHAYLDECPEWMQKAVIRGEQMYDIDTGFREYLKEEGVYDKFLKMSASEKSDYLVKFLDKNCLGIDRLKI